MYGAPHGWGANLLMWRTDDVTPAPTSWGVVFDPNSPYKGKVTAYDDPIYIADAALYLKKTQPDLKITNPYELDQKQFDAAVALLKKQHGADRAVLVGLHQVAGRASRRATVGLGTTWQFIANLLDGRQGAGQDDPADRGLDRLVGHLDAVLQGQAPELHGRVDELDRVAEDAGAGRGVVRRGAGQPEGVRRARRTRRTATRSTRRQAVLYDKVAFWATPTRNCRDDRGNVCVDYSKWVQAWTEIKG